MIEPQLLDVVELLVDLPDHQLSAGNRGAIVEVYPDQQYEVEFTNSQGETRALVSLSINHFVVVWRSRTQSWVSVEEKIEALVANLPEETRLEVFDFARFVYSRRQMAT